MRRLAAERLLPREGDNIEFSRSPLACANAADVASQIVRPSRLAGIQSAFGTRTPEVVPFQVNTTSVVEIDLREIGQLAIGGFQGDGVLELEFLDDIADPAFAKAISQASMVTGRCPSSDHSAISTAPVSDAGTMPMR